VFQKSIFRFGLVFFLLTLFLIFLLIKKYNAGRFLLRMVGIIRNEKIKYFLEEFLISFKIYLQRSKYILYFYLISLITQFLKIYLVVFVAKAIRLDMSITEIFLIIPAVGIVSFLPISINGLGIKEYVGSYLFAFLNKEIALISIFISIGNLIVILGNLVGAIFIFDKEKRSA